MSTSIKHTLYFAGALGIVLVSAMTASVVLRSPTMNYYIDVYRLGSEEWGYTITGKAMGEDAVFVHAAREFTSEEIAEAAAKEYRKVNLLKGTVDG